MPLHGVGGRPLAPGAARLRVRVRRARQWLDGTDLPGRRLRRCRPAVVNCDDITVRASRVRPRHRRDGIGRDTKRRQQDALPNSPSFPSRSPDPAREDSSPLGLSAQARAPSRGYDRAGKGMLERPRPRRPPHQASCSPGQSGATTLRSVGRPRSPVPVLSSRSCDLAAPAASRALPVCPRRARPLAHHGGRNAGPSRGQAMIITSPLRSQPRRAARIGQRHQRATYHGESTRRERTRADPSARPVGAP